MKNKKILIPIVLGAVLIVVGILVLTVFCPEIPMGQDGWMENESRRVPGIISIVIGAFALIASTIYLVMQSLTSPKAMAKSVKRRSDEKKEFEAELKKYGVYDEYKKMKKNDIDNELYDFDDEETSTSTETKSKSKTCSYCGATLKEDGSCKSCGAKK